MTDIRAMKGYFGLIVIRLPQMVRPKRGVPVFQIRYAAFALSLAAAATYSIAASALPVEHGEYKLPASFDAEVTTELETEEWARVSRPVPDAAYPLIIMLHGNHGTCGYYDPVHKVRIDDNDQYTFDGTCPSGYVVLPVTAATTTWPTISRATATLWSRSMQTAASMQPRATRATKA